MSERLYPGLPDSGIGSVGVPSAGTQILLPRAAEKERDPLLRGDHLVGLDAVLVVRKLGVP